MSLSCGSTLDPYEIVAPIGLGSMGEVFHGVHFLRNPCSGSVACASHLRFACLSSAVHTVRLLALGQQPML